MTQITEQYEQWMELETSYALTKFKPAEQYQYWDDGIARGHFSFMASSLSYMDRARIFAEATLSQKDPAGLRVVQLLGKAAHNLVAMHATGLSRHSSQSQLFAASTLFKRLADDLNTEIPFGTQEIVIARTSRHNTLLTLQNLQDADQTEAFHIIAMPELQRAANQFVSAAVYYGWPEPGHSSGNVVAWQQ